MTNETPTATTGDRFEPAPFQVVSEARQLKAFADPIRNRILHILAAREATTQQLATTLGEPQAKVLHHVRFLLDAGLIVLVEQRVRGGNVEKYYRATARLFGFRPDPADAAELSGPVSGAVLESVTQEFVASLTLWPEQPLYWETRRARLSPERAEDFNRALLDLIEAYWDAPDASSQADDADSELMAFATAMYRFPGDER
jgi:DNA-binding transcriptional ArsR family regulator